MANERTYKKGDKVWVQTPVEDDKPQKRLAIILSVVSLPAYMKHECQIAIHYLDLKGMAAYQCIPESWIIGYADEEQANDFQ